MPRFYYRKEHRREFEWKFQAQNFVTKLKKAARQKRLHVRTRIGPINKFISSGDQRWNAWDKFVGSKSAERRVVGYRVVWAWASPTYPEWLREVERGR